MKAWVGVMGLLLAMPAWAGVQLEVDERIRVLAIDDRPQSVGLFRPSHPVIELGEGTHTVQLRYEELFDRGADDHEVIRSSPSTLTLPANLASGRYRLTLDAAPQSLQQAQTYRKAPRFVLRQGQQTLLQLQGENLPEMGLVDRINQKLSGAINSEDRTARAEDSRMELFQQLWNSATPAERHSMLEWARQHP